MLQEEIFVAPALEFFVRRNRGMGIASRLHGGVEGDGVGIGLAAAAIEQRRQVGAASEPGPGGHDEARIHVYRRHVRIVRMCDEGNARGPEPRVGIGAGNLPAEFRRELAEHGRDVDADLLEHAARHHRHRAAPARLAAVIGAAPRRAREAAGRAVGERRIRRQCVLQRLEICADVVTQRLEPAARSRLAGIAGQATSDLRSCSARRR